jgi:sulfoxide reductase heme-binding subunit YedZ
MGLRDGINAQARRIPGWMVYAVLALPAPWLFYLAATGDLGVDPVAALEHEYGALALKLLIAGLCITPLRRHLGVSFLQFRRPLGLMAFFYVVLHLCVWAVLDVQSPGRVWADILKRPYISIGMVAFGLMLPLAVTSTNRAVRRLGRRWMTLHKLVYPVAILAGLHFIWLRKGLQPEPLIYMAIILVLLGARVASRRPRRRTQSA